MAHRSCNGCGTTDIRRFGTGEYSKYRCKRCEQFRAKRKYHEDPTRFRESALRYYHKNRDVQMSRNQKYEAMVKDEVFKAYGGYTCTCCKEKNKKFLTLDHIDGGGTKHRKEMGGGGKFHYRILYKKNFPPGYQILCMNCNFGKGQNENICPHEEDFA